MDWANNLFLALLLTDITGTIFFLAWQLLRIWTERDTAFQRFLMKVTLWAYLVPWVYVVLYLDRWFSTIGAENRINLFYNTWITRTMNAVLGCVWFGLFLVLLSRRLARNRRWWLTCRGNIPEEDEKVFKILEEVCAELGIKGRISVCRNDSVRIPCITYDHGFVVVMPLWCYTEKEMRVIFYHELCHLLNRDLFCKAMGMIVSLLHVFNPAAHVLYKQLAMNCEKYCDKEACKKGKDIFTAAEYCQVLLDISSGSKRERNRVDLFALADDESDCERRVRYMSEYHARGGLKKGTAVVLATCFLMGSSITSLAAGNGVEAVYETVAEKTSIKSEYDVNAESNLSDADKEAIEVLSKMYDLDPEDVIMMEDDGIALQGLFYNDEWYIPAGKTFMSIGFVQEVDDVLTLTVVGNPEDINYEMGFKDPNEIMWYVKASGAKMQNFRVDIAGRHYLFVTNKSETEELCADIMLRRPDPDNPDPVVPDPDEPDPDEEVEED